MGKFTFKRTVNAELIKSIVTHPKIYSKIVDDFAVKPDFYQPIMHPDVRYMLVYDAEELLGMFIFVPHNQITWEVHTCLLPNAWKGRSIPAAIEMTAWIWEHTICSRVFTNVPRSNRLALRFAKAAGMKEFGVNEKSVLRGGVLEDFIMLGISRPGVK